MLPRPDFATRQHVPWDANPGEIRRLAVFRALKLGDMLCAVPALRALRASFPEAHVTLIGLPWTRELVSRLSAYVDDLLEFPGYPGLPERELEPDAWEPFLADARARQFDLVIQMHGSGRISNRIVHQLGSRWTAGFHESGSACPRPAVSVPWDAVEAEPHRYLRLLDHLGVPHQGVHLEFPLIPDDETQLLHLRGRHRLDFDRLACVHAGASVESRRWSAEGFARVAEGLAQRGLQIALTGSSDERPLTGYIAGLMRHPTINLAGETSLGCFAALLSHAGLLVCNDTGASHMAAAMRTPSVVVFPVSDPRAWAPIDGDRHRIVDARRGAEPAAVLHAVDQLLPA